MVLWATYAVVFHTLPLCLSRCRLSAPCCNHPVSLTLRLRLGVSNLSPPLPRSYNTMSFTLSQPKMMLLLLLSFLLYPNIRAQQTLFPPAVPLAVRSPYLSSWFHIKNGTILNHSLPATFDPSQVTCHHMFNWQQISHLYLFQILGWVVLLRVDGYTYSFFGNASTSPVVGGGALYEMENAMVTVTPTQTIVSAEAWDMQVNLTFLNPIEVCLHPLFCPKH